MLRPELIYASAPDGTLLPVIDVTNPAFAAPETDAEIAALSAAALAEEEKRGPLQRVVIGWVLKALARRSRLIAALQGASGGFLGGLPTYVMKLGPDNLVPPFATDIDRRILQSPTVTSMRVRVVQVARLLAQGLAPRLAAAPGAPLAIVEIAGGPSSDALNALLLLEQQGVLAGRQVKIHVYDIDASGPAFGAAMLAALQREKLAGRDIALTHIPGNWSDTAALARLLATLPGDAIVAATSEGGLFEYGSDEDIRRCVAALAHRAAIVTGSVTRNDRLNVLIRRHSQANVQPRGLERFAELIAGTGYRIAQSRPAPLSDQVLLELA